MAAWCECCDIKINEDNIRVSTTLIEIDRQILFLRRMDGTFHL
jgi:hypothetical protein